MSSEHLVVSIKSLGRGQGHRSVTKYIFASGLPSAKRQSCSLYVCWAQCI